MPSKSVGFSIMGAALLAGALLAPPAVLADGGWGRDHRGHEHRERHHHHHKHKVRTRVIREYHYAPVSGHHHAPVVIYRDAPAIRLGRDNEISITYRGGW